jgi:hypothetical protein
MNPQNPGDLRDLLLLKKLLRPNLLLLLFLPRIKGREIVAKIPGLLNPKKLLLYRERQLMTHILRVSSARKFSVFCIFLFYPIFACLALYAVTLFQ